VDKVAPLPMPTAKRFGKPVGIKEVFPGRLLTGVDADASDGQIWLTI
jgi:hypothetical protein